MNTTYNEVYEIFIKTKLVGDTSFFKYDGVTNENEIITLYKDHCKNLMIKSVSEIYRNGVPEVDFNDRDDILEEFKFESTDTEKDLIIDGMYYHYMCEPRNKMKLLGLTFKSNELNVFSPANDRDSYEKMLKTLKDDLDFSIMSYLNRDRKTGKLKVKNFG